MKLRNFGHKFKGKEGQKKFCEDLQARANKHKKLQAWVQ